MKAYGAKRPVERIFGGVRMRSSNSRSKSVICFIEELTRRIECFCLEPDGAYNSKTHDDLSGKCNMRSHCKTTGYSRDRIVTYRMYFLRKEDTSYRLMVLSRESI